MEDCHISDIDALKRYFNLLREKNKMSKYVYGICVLFYDLIILIANRLQKFNLLVFDYLITRFSVMFSK